MDYWAETMQDDCYLIAADGWKAGAQPREILQVKNKDRQTRLARAARLQEGQAPLQVRPRPRADSHRPLLRRRAGCHRSARSRTRRASSSSSTRLREEQGGEEGLLAEVIEGEGDKQKITAKAVKARLKEIGKDPDYADERQALEEYAALLDQQADAKARLKAAQEDLDAKLDAKYPKLTEDEIKTLVVDDKWLATLAAAVQGELDRVSQTLTGRIRQLAERYATPLPQLTEKWPYYSGLAKSDCPSFRRARTRPRSRSPISTAGCARRAAL